MSKWCLDETPPTPDSLYPEESIIFPEITDPPAASSQADIDYSASGSLPFSKSQALRLQPSSEDLRTFEPSPPEGPRFGSSSLLFTPGDLGDVELLSLIHI